jgi:hypothetical protein
MSAPLQDPESQTNTPQYDSDEPRPNTLRPGNADGSSPSKSTLPANTKQGKLNLTQQMEEMERRAAEAAEAQEQRAQQLEMALQQITSMLAARGPSYTPPLPGHSPETAQLNPRDPPQFDDPLPTVETRQDVPRRTTFEPLSRTRPLRTEMSGARQSPDPLVRETAEPHQTPFSLSYSRKSQLTEKIPALDNGIEPTFISWRISIRDRLEVNEDHYPTERARKALVWGATAGQAKEYLQPRYLSESQDYTTAQEMIDLLATYFLTGNETEEKRREFHSLKMRDNETFPEFKARFLSLAIQGKVSESEWFFYLWEKISDRLRYAAGPVKILWNNSFPMAIQHLTSLDRERRAITQRSFDKPKTTSTVKRTTTTGTPSGVVQRSTYRSSTARPFAPSSGTNQNSNLVVRSTTPGGRPAFVGQRPDTARQTTPAPNNRAASGQEPICYGCGKTGHFRSECPQGPLVKEIAGDDPDEEGEVEVEEDPDSEEIREENDEA